MLLKSLMTTVGAWRRASSALSATDITGAGATFPFPIYAKWADAYKKQTNVGLNYESIGSGGGIKQIKNKTVTFGASDQPFKLAILMLRLVAEADVMGRSCRSSTSRDQAGRNRRRWPYARNIYLGKITKLDDLVSSS